MKKVLVILVALMCVVSAEAQFKFGVKAGVNLSEASWSVDALKAENLTGFQVGPMIEFMVPVLGLGFDAAALYSQQGFKYNAESFRQNSLDIPVNLKYKFNLIIAGAYLSAGPYARFSLSDIKGKWDTKSFGAGLNIGAGLELFSKLQLGVNYQIGLTDDYSSLDLTKIPEIAKGKPRIWSISAAYFF